MDYAESFGQRVDLCARLREILGAYPEGTSILRELIQNADDAGATVVKLCLDGRNHGTETLAFSNTARFQGPSLVAFNDARFSDSDFTSISRIGDSVKRDQVGKTGRYGLGFNSVYHLTDLPGACGPSSGSCLSATALVLLTTTSASRRLCERPLSGSV
jgi:sacsin